MRLPGVVSRLDAGSEKFAPVRQFSCLFDRRASGKVVRKIPLQYAEGQSGPVTVTAVDLFDMLGPVHNTQ